MILFIVLSVTNTVIAETIIFSNIEVVAVKNNSVVIRWDTDIAATGQIEYGQGTGYGSLTDTNGLNYWHSIEVTGLTEGTEYHFRIKAKDYDGNETMSEDSVFTTRTQAELEAIIRAARTLGDLPKVYYVKTDGNDSYSGLSIDSAWQHPSYATQIAEAGDKIYILDGTWYNEYCVFANSGIDTHPITITAYSGTWTLDGQNTDIIGIRITDKSYIIISNFHLKNYREENNGGAIKAEGLIRNLHLSDFIIENVGMALNFDSNSLQNSIITNFTMYNTGINSSHPAISHFIYSGSSCWNNIISNFTIRDTDGEAINWRNSKRIYIHDGEIYNTASDAIHLQLDVNNSIIENMWINNTGFHGIAIHDHTMGDYPCYNNIIRNCYVGYAKHNDIDLHSGAYNTIVENCEITGDGAVGQGIYFHNLGEGLIARNNTIYGESYEKRFHVGIVTRGDAIIENNMIYNVVYGITHVGDNITIKENVIYNTSAERTSGDAGENIFIEDNNISGGEYRLNNQGEAKVFGEKSEDYSVRTKAGANITVGYDSGKVFKRELTYYDGPYNLSVPEWHPLESYFTMESTPTWDYNGIVVEVTTYPITLTPTVENEYLTVSSVSDTSVTVESTVATNPTTIGYTNADYANYNVILVVDGVDYNTSLANDSGTVFHNYNGDWSTAHTFTWKQGTTNIDEPDENSKLPTSYTLFANYPNPFNPETVISYRLPESAFVELIIYNTLGQRIKTLVNQEQNAGKYQVKFNGSGLASGIYFYRLQVSTTSAKTYQFNKVRKMILLR